MTAIKTDMNPDLSPGTTITTLFFAFLGLLSRLFGPMLTSQKRTSGQPWQDDVRFEGFQAQTPQNLTREGFISYDVHGAADGLKREGFIADGIHEGWGQRQEREGFIMQMREGFAAFMTKMREGFILTKREGFQAAH